jgi:hypothetical protein
MCNNEFKFKCEKCNSNEYEIEREEDHDGNDYIFLKCNECGEEATDTQNEEYYFFQEEERQKELMKKYPNYVILATPFDYICDGARNLSEARKTEIARTKDIATAELIATAVSAKNSDQIIIIKPEWELIEEQGF